jgi:hypothetical protein
VKLLDESRLLARGSLPVDQRQGGWHVTMIKCAFYGCAGAASITALGYLAAIGDQSRVKGGAAAGPSRTAQPGLWSTGPAMTGNGPIRPELVNLRVVSNEIRKHASPLKYFSGIATSGNGLQHASGLKAFMTASARHYRHGKNVNGKLLKIAVTGNKLDRYRAAFAGHGLWSLAIGAIEKLFDRRNAGLLAVGFKGEPRKFGHGRLAVPLC